MQQFKVSYTTPVGERVQMWFFATLPINVCNKLINDKLWGRTVHAHSSGAPT